MRGVVGAMWAALSLFGCDPTDRGETCITGQSVACECPDGRLGAQTCEEGRPGACACDGADPVDAADAGADEDAAPCVPDDETCDGEDNDCDGVADEGHACDASVIAATAPFDRTVWFAGDAGQPGCDLAVQRFWPTLADDYIGAFDCHAHRFEFRPSDDALLYHATFSGIHVDAEGGDDPVILTPPCWDGVGQPFGFDGAGALHYQCLDTVRRSNGELVAREVDTYAATLEDGRSIVTRGGDDQGVSADFVVLGPDGHELSRLSPHDAFTTVLRAYPRGTTVTGNLGYVLYISVLDPDPNPTEFEFVVFRVDEASAWQQVRWFVTGSIGSYQLPLSDGTVLVREVDPEVGDPFTERIVAYSSEEMAIAWREADAVSVSSHSNSQLFVGPAP